MDASKFYLGNTNELVPSLGPAEFSIAWNTSGGRGETTFWQTRGTGWKGGYHFYSDYTEIGRLNSDGWSARGFSTTSDARLKSGVASIDDGLSKVLALRGVSFQWADGRDGGARHLGVIAQEVLGVVPELVRDDEGDGQSYSVEYGALAPLLIEAVKTQQQIIERLSQRVLELERRLGTAP
jgi:hypothetical protein